MSQPGRKLPWASDGNYPAGSDPWSGGARKSTLSSGEITAGVTPNTQIPAQKFNDLIAVIGDHIGALAPIAADNWPVRANPTVTITPDTIAGRGRVVQSIPGTPQLLVRTAVGVGGGTGPFIYSTRHPELDAAGDWTQSAAAGISDWITCGVKSASLICTVNNDASGNVRYTTDLGANWANGGTIGLGLDGTLYEVYYSPIGDRFLIVGNDGYNVWSRGALAATLGAGGAWTGANASPSSETDGMNPRAIASSSTETLIAWSGGVITRTTNGTSWTAASLPGHTGDVAGIAYSAAHSVWCALGTSGATWTSSTGAVWTAGLATPFTPDEGSRLAVLGRYFVCVHNAGNDQFKTFRRFDLDAAVDTHAIVKTDSGYGALEVHAHTDGRLVAYRGGTTQFGLAFSLRLAGA